MARRNTGKVVRKSSIRGQHRKARKNTVLKSVYRTGKEAARGMSVVALVSLFFLIIASVFLLYQWKEFKIRQTLREITNLKLEISRLRTDIVQKEGLIQRELLNYNRISRIAYRTNRLRRSVKPPRYLEVDKTIWHHWLEKDAAEEN